MTVPDQLPVRMLNEFVYCPRLFALEWVHGEWADSADTVHGRAVHRRVDRPDSTDPDSVEPVVVRSLHLGDDELGLVARIDLVEVEGTRAVPVDFKKGKLPRSGPWDPERVQICAQALLLRAHGWEVDRGVLYFAGSRRRAVVPIDEELVALTLDSLAKARAAAAQAALPPPLVDDPRCPRCSLVGICLPDETNRLLGKVEEVRPLIPPRRDGSPLYVQLQGGSLGKSHDEIVVREKRVEVGRVRMADTTRVVVLGNVTVTTPLLRALAERDIPISWHSYGGWHFGTFRSMSGNNVALRMAQHQAAADPDHALALARSFVHSKILNSRVMLRRNASDLPRWVLSHLNDFAEQALKARLPEQLLGLEGTAARLYFEHLPRMLRANLDFAFEGRNRRPPLDPINALLSFAYAALSRDLVHILDGMGFDPFVGFLHRPRFGRPALALDLMEEFRPIIADSAVLTAVNTQMLQEDDFLIRKVGVSLTPSGRSKFVHVLEKRLDEEITHPLFGTRLSYRRILEVQARLLSRVLLGELAAYPEFRVR